MPSTRISTRQGWIAGRQRAVIEVDPSNWGLSGKPASEIDLGFKIDV